MKILATSQIRSLDSITIAKEPIKSIDLMERVAMICTRLLMKLIPNEESIYVICGKGNNGGDGLAIARLLLERGYTVKVCVINYKKEFSVEAESNYKLLQTKYQDHVFEIDSTKELTACLTDYNSVIIDALIGSGLNNPIKGFLGEVIKLINSNFKNIISIDVPSGLFIDSTSIDNPYIIQSTLTLSLQFPKLAFLLPENSKYIPQFELVDIGLHKEGIAEIKTKN
jgi:NAD(P)H-hydrate epimerase